MPPKNKNNDPFQLELPKQNPELVAEIDRAFNFLYVKGLDEDQGALDAKRLIVGVWDPSAKEDIDSWHSAFEITSYTEGNPRAPGAKPVLVLKNMLGKGIEHKIFIAPDKIWIEKFAVGEEGPVHEYPDDNYLQMVQGLFHVSERVPSAKFQEVDMRYSEPHMEVAPSPETQPV